MSNIYRIITLLLIISIAACVSDQTNMTAANDEDKDIGLGGTGMVADAGSGDGSGDGSGLGGTGIVGKITGYGSIFVNGIEVEYDNDTAFTINGESAIPQKLEIGDVVEVLTIDAKQHTQAQLINLRHEIIGEVESVEPHTYSFTINGQSIIQPIDKSTLPGVGTTVAVAGFRIDGLTILSTRITPAETGQVLLRTGTELPFINKTRRWLVQTHVQARSATIQHKGVAYTFALMEKTNKSYKDRLGIKILQLQKSATEKLELKQVIEATSLPRGRRTLIRGQQQGGNMLKKTGSGSVLTPGSGSSPTRIYGQPKGKQNGKL